MFSKAERRTLILAGLLVATGLFLIAWDPTPHGFGPATLWIAPPLLLTGFFLPSIVIAGAGKIWLRVSSFREPKQIFGIMAFIAALCVYILTLEPTASLWDCSEFIASAYKLQVPHTPGTPLSLLIGRLFAMLSFGDVTRVASCLNFMSALFSALTVFIVYHIIYYLGDRILSTGNSRRLILVIASLGGSLCLAFSDTFWFSAVEAETYGIACFFLMLLVWLILTGGDLAEPDRSRRMILIFYLAGLAYCIHPMCLLALPMLPFTWMKRDRRVTLLNVVLPVIVGLLIIIFINRFVAVGAFELAFSFDRFFVNVMRLPFYSGALIMVALATFLFWYVLRKWRQHSVYLRALLFLLIGFLPYLVLFIRSNHNPPIDETNPENLALIKAYMNRESYPSSPLLWGPYFDAKIIDVTAKKRMYYKDENEYAFAGTLPEYVYDARQTFLPRIYSNDAAHIETYRSWTGMRANEKPDFCHNLKFMFRYQLGHMYFRYLMWNFAGRNGDEQNSDWLRPWEAFGSNVFERARNQFWMIPLLLGICGAVCHGRGNLRGFISVSILFLVTGVILALYLNAPPNEPRERDYIYVGSFIAFCVWIGFGFLFVGKLVRRFSWGPFVLAAFGLLVPVWIIYQNYNDHDRSGRTFQVDNARNILRSCAPDSILFTGGDNDTFPLWYLQEVEGFRTDVRVMVLSYMNTDWYINQLRRTYYDSEAFRLTLEESDYRQYGAKDVLYVQETLRTGIDFGQYLQLLKRGHPGLTMKSRTGEPYHILPSRILQLNVPRQAHVLNAASNALPGASAEMTIHVTDNYLSKSQLAILDLIISNGWERPVYFNFTSMTTLGVDISAYLVQEGPVFRLDATASGDGAFTVDTSLSYRNLVENADYDNLKDPDVYFSYEDHFARMITPVRQSFNQLAGAFLEKGDHDMARKVMTEAMDRLYPENLPPSYTNLQAAEIFLALDENELAEEMVTPASEYYFQKVERACEVNERPSELDLYLAMQSAEFLAERGKPAHHIRLGKLEIRR